MSDEYRRNGKIILISPYDDEGEEHMLWLTDRQRQVLLVLCHYLDWKNRLKTIPPDWDTDDKIDTWNDELRERLMTEVNFCEYVANCIKNSDGTRDAITQLVMEILNGKETIPGKQLPVTELEKNLPGTTNPGCDPDIFFAQCSAVVKQTHLLILDVLQIVEVATNVVEFIDAAWDTIPAVGTLDDISGIEGVKSLFLYYQEAIGELYEAQFTETFGGTYDELRFNLFCAYKYDCNLTVDRIAEFYFNRVLANVSIGSFSDLIDLVEILAGIDQDSGIVVDIVHWAAWEMLRIAGLFFGSNYKGTLQLIIQAVADEPDNDHIALDTFFGGCSVCVFQVSSTVDPSVSPFGHKSTIHVMQGKTYTITADGTWTYGGGAWTGDADGNIGLIVPATVLGTTDAGRLLWKVGMLDAWKPGGTEFTFTAEKTGFLYFAMNDTPGQFGNNSGTLCLSVL